MKTVLLRLSGDGKPVNSGNIANGVLTFPSFGPGEKISDEQLFVLNIQIDAGAKISRNGRFFTNVPKLLNLEFARNSFQEVEIKASFDKDTVISIPIFKPGAYCYYIVYHDSNGEEVKTQKYYFTVPPNLVVKGSFLPFNSISIQTLVSKWMGPLERWDALFRNVANKGYNMIHFTPLQQRGVSNSPYSIYDQLRFDPNLFDSNDTANKFLKTLLKKYNLLSLTDVVWNHTADNSQWIREHPESGYNAETAPHLKAAIELDAKLLEFSNQLHELGLPVDIENMHDLNKVMDGIKNHVIRKIKLWQYYVFDKESIVSEVLRLFDSSPELPRIEIPQSVNLNNLVQLSSFVLSVCNLNKEIVFEDRFSNKLNGRKLLGVVLSLGDTQDTLIDNKFVKEKLSQIIDEINVKLYEAYDSDVEAILNQLKDRIRYLRLDDNGPKAGPVTKKDPLTEPYFTRFQDANGKDWQLANNGWIWGGDPLSDFASNESKAYLRREVIVWGDCIKLRYGSKPEDSPYLWKRMIEYTKQCASLFDGFRIDNCHSTPLHVGETLLDVARSVNSNLYVVAELFSGSEEMDKIFVERLALNSLIREAMQAWNVAELSRLVHKHGGRPIGSLTWLPLNDFSYPATKEPEAEKGFSSYSELDIPKILNPQEPHALFMDCTHDNEMPNQKRTVEDTLPNAALVAFCSSAIGSVFGFDECYPELLNVVTEERLYDLEPNGIGIVKAKLHDIRERLSNESEDILRDHEMYIHHEGQYITIQRYNARTGKGWFLIARTKFSSQYDDQVLSPCFLGGTKVKHEFSYTLEMKSDPEENSTVVKGVSVELKELGSPDILYENGDSTIKPNTDFVPGSIAVFSTKIPNVSLSLDNFVKEGAIGESKGLDLYDLNLILYRCEPEERDASDGAEGVYTIPNYGSLVYAGLEGWIVALKKVIWQNDLSHPICNHLREGLWPLDYIVNRLDKYKEESEGIQRFQKWLKSRVDSLRKVPFFLRPHYFALVIGVAYEACRFRALRQFPKNIQEATNFVQSLSLTSVQMVGKMKNTSLKAKDQVPCIAAGLPHFSNDYMRCWGRDVFISFRGLLLAPGRFEDAKAHILGFAQTLKHGLIPNLLDAGRNPRYNARDAAWFFIQAVKEYVSLVPGGHQILDEKVARRFPLNDDYIPYEDDRAFSYESSIKEILYEIVQRHAQGIKYREANAGPNLDSQMSDQGFNVEIEVDWSTGLIHGGSQFNCGTWMDKMGESEKAGNKGVPGTPRDGAAIEIQGLLKSTLEFFIELNNKGAFEYSDVVKADGSHITFTEWDRLLSQNFEKCFYIPVDPSDDDQFDVDLSIVNRRGIYKDLYKSGKPYEDYQLRANFPIAMVVAPSLFTPENAINALNLADKVIRGPVGMCTLDPSDWNYRPYYINSEDSEDFATAKGRNYHQGPEWVWLTGYFLRAFLMFHHSALIKKESHSKSGKPSSKSITAISSRIEGHIEWIKSSPWSGLTELTNKDGELCHDSSPTQAWSTSCLLDLYYDLWSIDVYQ